MNTEESLLRQRRQTHLQEYARGKSMMDEGAVIAERELKNIEKIDQELAAKGYPTIRDAADKYGDGQ